MKTDTSAIMSDKRVFHAKLILFGEYSMILGNDALLVPFEKFGASWAFDESLQKAEARSSNEALRAFLEYLRRHDGAESIDLEKFADDLDHGIYLDSNLPIGYGLGSSGTVVAAVYDRYHTTTIDDPLILKTLFAKMENKFHSSSSGNDPLQCYLGKPFIIRNNHFSVLEKNFLPSSLKIDTIDSQQRSETGPLVAYFKEQLHDNEYRLIFEEQYLPTVQKCINTLIGGNLSAFFTAMEMLSLLQLRLFRPMITDNMLPLFEEGLATKQFFMKISGSGGGGYFLRFQK